LQKFKKFQKNFIQKPFFKFYVFHTHFASERKADFEINPPISRADFLSYLF